MAAIRNRCDTLCKNILEMFWNSIRQEKKNTVTYCYATVLRYKVLNAWKYSHLYKIKPGLSLAGGGVRGVPATPLENSCWQIFKK